MNYKFIVKNESIALMHLECNKADTILNTNSKNTHKDKLKGEWCIDLDNYNLKTDTLELGDYIKFDFGLITRICRIFHSVNLISVEFF